MPTYVYELRTGGKRPGCPFCCGGFELVQRMSDEPCTKCPECGAPVERRIQAPFVGDAGKLKGPTEQRIANAGFTQYKRKGKGYYEKSFGQGPGTLHG